MTLHRRVATPLVTKSSTGPALSLHSGGKILDEKPMMSWGEGGVVLWMGVYFTSEDCHRLLPPDRLNYICCSILNVTFGPQTLTVMCVYVMFGVSKQPQKGGNAAETRMEYTPPTR